jgi:hypothetical protein
MHEPSKNQRYFYDQALFIWRSLQWAQLVSPDPGVYGAFGKGLS